MSRRIIPGLLFIVIASAAVLPAVAMTADKEKGVLVQVTGRVRLVGSDTQPDIIISWEDKQWYIASEDAYKLKNMQQRIVTIEGKETIKEMKFASGRSAGKRNILSDIRIIAVK
ncbi:MAG: hypothetical protein FWG92_02185 [Leptospirales bacterium]|nr:hypothetical protein [Leptospirales bacterium]